MLTVQPAIPYVLTIKLASIKRSKKYMCLYSRLESTPKFDQRPAFAFIDFTLMIAERSFCLNTATITLTSLITGVVRSCKYTSWRLHPRFSQPRNHWFVRLTPMTSSMGSLPHLLALQWLKCYPDQLGVKLHHHSLSLNIQIRFTGSTAPCPTGIPLLARCDDITSLWRFLIAADPLRF